MSFLSTSSNYCQNSVLTDKKFISLEKTQENSSKSIHKNQKNNEINNINNILDYGKLKGIKRYENFSIFSVREKDNKKKGKLILKLKNNASPSGKNKKNLTSINSIYITQSSSLGDMTQLPSIFGTNESIKNIKTKKIINYKSKLNKIIEKVNLNDNLLKRKKSPIRNFFFNNLENILKKREAKTNKSSNFLLNKRLYELNRFRTIEKSHSTHISKFHEFLDNKIVCDYKKERYTQLREAHINKMELEIDKKNSLCKSQELLEQKYIVNCKKYLSKIYKDFDAEENTDNILCEKIIELKKIVNSLKKKIDDLLIEKYDCLKWMLFQIQIKEKLLKLPEQYQDFFQISKMLPDNLIKYQKEIIYPSPEDLIDRITHIENNNINLMDILVQTKKKSFPFKIELEKIIINLEDTKDNNEYNDLILMKDKIKAQNELLINKLINIKDKLKINTPKSSNGKNNSIIYQKIRCMYTNIVGKEIKKRRNKNEEKEILNMLASIEIIFNKELEINKYYQINNKEQYEILNSIMIKNKIHEKVMRNKNKLIEMKKLSNQRIIEKAKKKVLLPKIKINWDVYKIKKKNKSQINIYNSNKDNDEIEKDFDFFCYD